MNTAKRIIAKFGSQSNLAKLIGKRQSTVQHWAKSGIIPTKWQAQLLEIAKTKGLELTAQDFFTQTISGETTGTVPSLQNVNHWENKKIDYNQGEGFMSTESDKPRAEPDRASHDER